MKSESIAKVRRIVDALVNGDDKCLHELIAETRVPFETLIGIAQEFPVRIGLLPDHSETWLDAVEVTGSRPPTFHLAVPMFDTRGAEADLTLELYVHEPGDGSPIVEVLDFHTL